MEKVTRNSAAVAPGPTAWSTWPRNECLRTAGMLHSICAPLYEKLVREGDERERGRVAEEAEVVGEEVVEAEVEEVEEVGVIVGCFVVSSCSVFSNGRE